MEKILSICIPSYNVECYIQKTLDSIIKSNYLELLDIIVVNDGSTDNTEKIANEFESRYTDSIRVINKTNGGYGSVLNVGLKNAVGKYFCLLDGDDWYETAEFDKTLEFIINNDCDLFICNHNRVDATTFQVSPVKKCDLQSKKCLDFEKSLPQIGYDKYLGISDIFIRTNIWRENNIAVDELTHYVDMQYCTYYIPYVKTVFYCDTYPYQYRVGNSMSGSQMDTMVRLFENHINITKSLIVFYEKYNENMLKNSRAYVKDKVFRMIKRDFEILLERYHRTGKYKEIDGYIMYLEAKSLFADKFLRKWRLIRIKKPLIYKIYYALLKVSR